MGVQMSGNFINLVRKIREKSGKNQGKIRETSGKNHGKIMEKSGNLISKSTGHPTESK